MRYISDKVISFSIVINGSEKRVRFTPRMQGGSIYLTNNPAEIKELEDSDMFGRVYSRGPGCEGEEVSVGKASAEKAGKKGKGGKKNNPDLTIVEEVANWQEAAEYLTANYSSESLTDPEAIVEEATKKGVSFPNLR